MTRFVKTAGSGAEAGSADGGEVHVLLVDDNEMHRRLMLAFLARPGYRVEIASDGCAAVAAVAGGAHDVVLMDLRLPGIDGLEATRRIRALPGPGRGVHVIAVTADATGGTERRCREAGMNDYMSKPLRLEMLEAKLVQLRRPAAQEPD